MSLFKKKLVIGVNPELINNVKDKVKVLKESRDELSKKYDELIKKVSVVEGKCEAISDAFDGFKKSLMNEFLSEARKELRKELKSINDSINNNHSRILKVEDELIKINKARDDFEFTSSFQDYYQLIKFCIYFLTTIEPSNHSLITSLLQTIHSLIDDMRRNGFWSSGRDAIITSLINLKSYWRSKDERVESLISAEIDALEKLR